MAKVDFPTLYKILPYVFRARKPILIRGPHGIGKSQLPIHFAPLMAEILYPDPIKRNLAYKPFLDKGKKNYVYPIIDRRASQMADAGELIGLPFIEGETTDFRQMKWFHEACIKPIILFFDEIDRANKDVRNALFELNDSRKLYGHTLHPDTVLFGCVNSGVGDNRYQVSDMDPAEQDRWTTFDLLEPVQGWLSHTKSFIAPDIHDFIRMNNGHLEHNGDFDSNKVYPSRRSWCRFDETLKGTKLLDNIEDNYSEVYYICQGYLGEEAAITFCEFMKNREKQVTVEDVIVKGDFKVAKKLEINQHMALMEKFSDHEIFKAEFSEAILQNVGKYLALVPAELAMKLWEIVTASFPSNGVSLHQSIIEHPLEKGKMVNIGEHLAKLHAG